MSARRQHAQNSGATRHYYFNTAFPGTCCPILYAVLLTGDSTTQQPSGGKKRHSGGKFSKQPMWPSIATELPVSGHFVTETYVWWKGKSPKDLIDIWKGTIQSLDCLSALLPTIECSLASASELFIHVRLFLRLLPLKLCVPIVARNPQRCRPELIPTRWQWLGMSLWSREAVGKKPAESWQHSWMHF